MTLDKTRSITLAFFPWTKTWHWLTPPKASRKSNKKLLVRWGANRKPLPLSPLSSRASKVNQPLLFKVLVKQNPRHKLLGPLLGILTVRGGLALWS